MTPTPTPPRPTWRTAIPAEGWSTPARSPFFLRKRKSNKSPVEAGAANSESRSFALGDQTTTIQPSSVIEMLAHEPAPGKQVIVPDNGVRYMHRPPASVLPSMTEIVIFSSGEREGLSESAEFAEQIGSHREVTAGKHESARGLPLVFRIDSGPVHDELGGRREGIVRQSVDYPARGEMIGLPRERSLVRRQPFMLDHTIIVGKGEKSSVGLCQPPVASRGGPSLYALYQPHPKPVRKPGTRVTGGTRLPSSEMMTSNFSAGKSSCAIASRHASRRSGRSRVGTITENRALGSVQHCPSMLGQSSPATIATVAKAMSMVHAQTLYPPTS